MLQLKLFRYKWVAVSWLIFISILFVLPGSAFPKENFFTKIHFDKWVHIGLFFILVYLWRSAYEGKPMGSIIFILVFSLTYGFAVEFVQENWVPNRSFDLYDVLADMSGAVLGIIIWNLWYKKNKPL